MDLSSGLKRCAVALAVLACAVLGVAVGDGIGQLMRSLVAGEGHRYCYVVTDERGGTYRTDSTVQAMEVVAGLPAVRWEDGGEVVYLFRPMSVAYDVSCEPHAKAGFVEAQR
jgi:hypothetical protein